MDYKLFSGIAMGVIAYYSWKFNNREFSIVAAILAVMVLCILVSEWRG